MPMLETTTTAEGLGGCCDPQRTYVGNLSCHVFEK